MAAHTRAGTIERVIDAGWDRVRATAGYLTEREARFLMTAAALAPASGGVVEIGSFKGRSTVGLAYVVRECGRGGVAALDPHTAPASTDPDLDGRPGSYDDFIANLDRAGVRDVVEIHRAYSHDVARSWSRPIRLLWIDGDHTYEGALADFRLFRAHLAPGAIVAMHDVLGTFEGSLRVFADEVLGSDDFGPVGLCGSIGWGQYRPGRAGSLWHRGRRALLSIPIRRLIPIARRGRRIRGVKDKYAYKLWRALAPHGGIPPERFARLTRLPPPSEKS